MLTPDEMKMFEAKLLARKERILKNIDDTYHNIELMRNQDPKDEVDFATLSADTDIDIHIIRKQQEELNEIEIALGKIEDGTYGVCEMCGEPIGRARLEVKNFARFCISCRELNEKRHH